MVRWNAGTKHVNPAAFDLIGQAHLCLKEACRKTDKGLLEKTNPNFQLACTMTEMSKSKKEWNGETGPINPEMLSRNLSNLQGPIYYIAGPPAMAADLKKMLVAANVDEDDIRTEDFAGY